MVFKKTLARYFLLLLATTLGLALLLLSTPRLRASLAFLPVETALQNHWDLRPISRDRFPALIDAAQKSIALHGDSQYFHGLGWMHYLHAIALGFDTAEARESLGYAQHAFEARLKSSPVEPAEWLRLGWTHLLLRHPASNVMDCWKASVFTGRAEHYLLLDRLKLGLHYTDYFDDDGLNLLRDQIQLSWKYSKPEMIQYFSSRPFDVKLIRGLLFERAPELLAEMEEAYEAVR